MRYTWNPCMILFCTKDPFFCMDALLHDFRHFRVQIRVPHCMSRSKQKISSSWRYFLKTSTINFENCIIRNETLIDSIFLFLNASDKRLRSLDFKSSNRSRVSLVGVFLVRIWSYSLADPFQSMGNKLDSKLHQNSDRLGQKTRR